MYHEQRDEPAQIDRAALRILAEEAADNDPEIMLELIDIYVEDTAEHLARIGRAIPEKDFPQIRLSAHSVKSSSATFGARNLSSYCERMETCARSEDMPCIEEALASSNAEYVHIRRFLLEERERWSAQNDAK